MVLRMQKAVAEASRRLRNGEIVAFPTETVFGLGASVRDERALRCVFQVKQRPFFDPLICHIHSVQQVSELSAGWPEWADILASDFWPGPLTLILPKQVSLNPLITSGLDSVGVRMPNHPTARELLVDVNIPIAAPSANRFGRTSPTSAQHVREEFPDGQFFILEGDPCSVGIESTVVEWDAGNERLNILRPGIITQSELSDSLRRWKSQVDVSFSNSSVSPGHTEFHYQPERPLILIERSENVFSDIEKNKIAEFIPNFRGRIEYLRLNVDPVLCARTLYSDMRSLAKLDIDCMIVFREPTPQSELWLSIWNRIEKAASLKI